MPPRLIATDLDGTLVRDDRSIGARTVRVLRRIVSDGVPVVLVTGRPVRWLVGVYEQLGIRPVAVCANGAAVYDPIEEQIIHAVQLEPPALREACRRLRAELPSVAFAVEVDGGLRMRHEPAYPLELWQHDRPDVGMVDPEELFAQPAAKLLVRAGRQPPDEFTARVGHLLAGVGEATHSSSSGMVEVSAAGVTKASGLAWVADRFGVPARDVIAFGDMPNDLAMLGWAGHSVAMVNGHPAVRAAAHTVTAHSNDADGVATHLEALFAGLFR